MFDEQSTGAPTTALVPVKNYVSERLPVMLKVIPKGMHERFRQAAMAVCQIPSVSQCTPSSVASVIYSCARLNLIPDPVLKLAYPIAFKRKLQLVLGYPGLIDLARRACPDLQLHTGCVYANDRYLLEEGTVNNVKVLDRHWQRGEESGEVLFSYCAYATTSTSRWETVIVPRSRLDALADAARAKSSTTPWSTDFDAMCEKTAIRRASRFWTFSPDRQPDALRFREAIAADEGGDLPDCPAPENEDLAAIAEGEHPIGDIRGRRAIESRDVGTNLDA